MLDIIRAGLTEPVLGVPTHGEALDAATAPQVWPLGGVVRLLSGPAGRVRFLLWLAQVRV